MKKKTKRNTIGAMPAGVTLTRDGRDITVTIEASNRRPMLGVLRGLGREPDRMFMRDGCDVVIARFASAASAGAAARRIVAALGTAQAKKATAL